MIIPTQKTLQDRLNVGLRTLRNKRSGESEETDQPPGYEDIDNISPSEPTPAMRDFRSSTSFSRSIPIMSGSAAAATSPSSGSSDTRAVNTSNSPVNNISISRPFGSIDCKYTIDPTLTLFPSSSRGTRIRSNVKLRTNVGTINADLTLMCGAKENTSTTLPRATLDISSKMGTVDVTLRRPSASSFNLPIIRLFASSRTGSLSILIPTNFQGFMVAHTKLGRLTLSSSVQSSAVVLREDMKLKRVFIGDPVVMGDSRASEQPAFEDPRRSLRNEMESGRQSDLEEEEEGSATASESEEMGRERDGGWKGDGIVLRTIMGSIEVGYADEENVGLRDNILQESIRADFGRRRGHGAHKGNSGRGRGNGRGGRGKRGRGRSSYSPHSPPTHQFSL